jgi:hypothetical protein
MMKSIKRMILMAGASTLVVVSLAAPAMAAEVQDHPNDPSPVDEEPYKDPGIRLCDITPTECEDTDDSRDDHDGDNSGAHPDAYDPNPVEEESEGEANAPGAVKAGAVKSGSAPDEAGQMANSGTIYGCAYDDYVYDEEFDTCVPTGESFGFFPVLSGDEPWPDTAGGYVGLLGDFVSDLSIGAGVGFLQIGLGHYVGDTLVEFGEGGGHIGWGIQGLGYTIGFTDDAAGVLVEGAGQIVDAVSEGVGDVVDAVGDAAEDAWDEVTSWF